MTVIPRVYAEFTTTHSYRLGQSDKQGRQFTLKTSSTHLFDELILSWNGKRPSQGKWSFWVSLKQEEKWSEPLLYAEWSASSQRTFKCAAQGAWAESYQDAVYPKEGYCNAFQIKVLAEEGASLETLDSVHICLSSLNQCDSAFLSHELASIQLPNIKGRSQMQLPHPRASDLCSPTATINAIEYLLGRFRKDPLDFASKVRDYTFDIYGNWILNTAQAYIELQGRFECQTKRLPHFGALHSYLLQKLPVVVSIRGPLKGSPLPMTFGHLICIVGYEAPSRQVLCIDSGFPQDDQTLVRYTLEDFLEAWKRRCHIAYTFTRLCTIFSGISEDALANS